MKKSLRLLVFSGMLAVLASPVFADSGPGGGGNPPPPPQTGNSALTPSGSTSTTSSTSTTGTITTIVNEIESVLGAVL